ncbi:J domain-containing protein [Hymenobacter psychrotolerans]|uniref:Tetratricopeptide repeat-containing protein n=1 Tax=Hymenobacter psychrotolerans DSM 18569 TaxID=1121959 RepID=A0A1M6Q2T4_9BACT|nr:J domain-containing protein [Hymenobacter psychrotolerans]SHK14498.1 Tetratricopeptide repeat-containing protein [Hymenobacter psychrotolerans DSM 18569]
MSQNHYQTLGIPATASAQDVKQAYKRLAVALHPDKHGGSTLYEERFKAVAIAYGVLGDPNRRAAYDHQLRVAAQRAAEALRQQQYQSSTQHLYGVPMPPPAPLRTRRPAGASERHYRPIVRQRRFTRRDYLLAFGLLAGLLVFFLTVKLTMDHVTAVSNYEDGMQAYGQQKWETAHAYFSQALHFKPTYREALRRRAEIDQLINHNYKAAQEDYMAALAGTEQAADRARLLYRLGQCQISLGEADAAEQSLTVALALDSTQSGAWLARGEVRLFEQQSFARAIEDLSVGLRQRMAQGKPLSVKYITYRGLAYYKLQDLQQARLDYRQVLEANPRNGQVHFLLGRVAQQEGNALAACEFFTRAVRLGYVYADEARRQNCP